MEAQFFTYLLDHLRKNSINAYYSVPLKSAYPALEIDHKETQVFAGKEIICFNAQLFFDNISQQSFVDFSKKVEELFENNAHTFEDDKYSAMIKINGKKQPIHERGKLRQYTLECTALIRQRSLACVQ